MDPGGASQSLQVGGIRSKDVVSVLSKANHRGVDRIRGPGAGKQLPGPSAELVIDRDDVRARKQSRDRNLLAVAAAPHLSDDTAIREWNTSVLALPLNQCRHIIVSALGGYERPSVQNQHHATPEPLSSTTWPPRTTTARAFALR
jgi:hypothetical protein